MLTITLNNQTVLIDDGIRITTGKPIQKLQRSVSTFIETIAKEVKSQPKSVQKRFYKILKVTYLSAIPLLVTSKAHANYPLLDGSYESKILPSEIVDILKEIILAAGVIGVLFAILLLMISGGYRMIGQRDKAQSWSKDIIGGLGMVLLSPVIILILVTLTSLIFRNVPGLDIFF